MKSLKKYMPLRMYYNLLYSAFWGWLSTESQPQNPEFRNNPENFHPCRFSEKHTQSWSLPRNTCHWECSIICLIQHFEADFPQKVSLKILNSGIILKIFTHVGFQRNIRPLVKSVYPKANFLISQPKYMLCVLKRTVSMRRFFWAPKTYV